MKKQLYRAMAAVLTLSLVSVPFSSISNAANTGSMFSIVKDIGFQYDGKDWIYLNAFGNKITGWVTAPDGYKYHMNVQNGIMDTGWFLDTEGKWYFLNEVSDGTVHYVEGKGIKTNYVLGVSRVKLGKPVTGGGSGGSGGDSGGRVRPTEPETEPQDIPETTGDNSGISFYLSNGKLTTAIVTDWELQGDAVSGSIMKAKPVSFRVDESYSDIEDQLKKYDATLSVEISKSDTGSSDPEDPTEPEQPTQEDPTSEDPTQEEPTTEGPENKKHPDNWVITGYVQPEAVETDFIDAELSSYQAYLPKTITFNTSYTSHVSARAFKDNFIEKLTTSERQEEIGESAFENNRIESLYVYGFMEGYTDGLTEIPSAAFRNNRLTEVKLPVEINKVASDAFDNNSNGDQRFIIQSDNEDIFTLQESALISNKA